MKRRDAYDTAKRMKRKSRGDLAKAMAEQNPDIVVTLGTNRPMSCKKLLELVDETIFEFEQKTLRTRRPYKKSAKDRVCAFIMPEKLDTNAHVHLMIFFPHRSAWSRCKLREDLIRERHKSQYVGHRRDYDRHDSYDEQYEGASLLEHLWRKRGKGFHYFAEFINETPEKLANYVTKEQSYLNAAEYDITCIRWSKSQPDGDAAFKQSRY